MKKIINTIIKKANGRNTLILLFIQLLIYFIFNVSIEPTFETFSNGLSSPDLAKFYKPSYINEVFANTSDEGWHYYLTRFSIVDFFYPAIYAISFGFLISYLYKKNSYPIKLIKILVIIPIITAIVDYFENFSIIYLIFSRPNIPEILTQLLSLSTGFKFLGISLSIVIILIGLLKWLLKPQRIKN